MSSTQKTACPAGDTSHGNARLPTQPRGRARVDAILDATARIIAEQDLAALTMHGIARQASTSIGSLYHFFPNLASVLEALVARHETRIQRIKADLVAVPRETWQALSVADAVEQLISPYVEYARQYPDFFPLMHGRRSPANEANFTEVLARVLAARLPELSAAAVDRHAAMLHAMASGTVHVAYLLEPEQMAFYMKEIPRAVAAYLADLEREVRG